MSDAEQACLTDPSRRRALMKLAQLMAAAPAAAATTAAAQTDPRPLSEHRRFLTLAEMQTTFDFEPVFFSNVPLRVYDYTAHGEGSEFTLRRNRQAFDWVDIRPATAPVPASRVDLSSELLGVKMKFPILVGPSATQAQLHPDGEKGMFQAATAAGAKMVLSVNTSTPVDQVAKAVPTASLWAQLYPVENAPGNERLVDTYQSAGCNGIVITVDQQSSFYERSQQDLNLGGLVRTPAKAAVRPDATGAARYRISTGRLWYTWQYIDATRKLIKGPMIIKGILTAEDARLCIEHGADAIIVSNHGGRSMDYGPSSLEVLPEIVAAVDGKIPVLFDSGVRRGSDIFKALALGADAVLLGRTARWGLAAFGAAGAQRVLEILQQELVQTAAAAGCARLSDVDRTRVETRFV